MTRACVLLASAILVLGGAVCRADEIPVPQPAPTPHVEVVAESACEGDVLCPKLHPLWGWLTYRPLNRTCACTSCKCDSYYCAPPVYTFFLDHCAGGCDCGHGCCSTSHH